MDLILDILILKSNFDRLKLNEIFVEWGGEKFPHTPKKYRFKTSIILNENDDMSYYEDIIGPDIDIYNYIALTLEGDNLSELEFMINKNKLRKDSNELIALLYELYNTVETFSIIKLVNEEIIDNKYILSNGDEAIDIFINSLNWDSPKGIVITKK